MSLEWLGTGRGGISPDPDALADVPTADAELVDVEKERMLLAGFLSLPRRSQQLLLDLVDTLQSGRPMHSGSPPESKRGSRGCASVRSCRLTQLGAASVRELHGEPENMVFALPRELRLKLVD